MKRQSCPFLLLPGLLCTTELYSPQLPLLWKYGPVMVANHAKANDMQAVAKQILEAAPPQFIQIGLSMGGYLALEILRQAPDRVLGAVFMDTSARPDTPQSSAGRKENIAKAQQGGFDEVFDEMFPKLVTPEHTKDAHIAEVCKRMARDVGVEGFTNQQQAIISRLDSRPLLGRIKCSSLVVVGEHDKLIPYEHSKEIADGISGAQLAQISQSAHLPTIENPAQVNATLKEWLDKL